MVRKDE
jgi:hypothetical protein